MAVPSPASCRQLTHDAGWSFEDAADWLARSLVTLLLARRR